MAAVSTLLDDANRAIIEQLQADGRRSYAAIATAVGLADGDLSEVADKLASLPEVDYVVVTAGSFDLLVEVVCNDDQHLLSLLNNSIRAVPGVRDSETFVYLKLAKQTYTWGVR
jgi:Lrp/AsnC family transcriptional regulator for asnA, asnC and gidA